MRLTSPAQALLWSCWKRSNLQLLLVMLGVMAFLVPMLSLDIFVPDLARRNEMTGAFIYAELFILWAASPGIAYNPRVATHGIGFNFDQEFARPVGTSTLVFLPLAYLCAIMIIAYLVPTYALSVFFDLAPPNLTMLFLIVETIIIISAVQWWSTSIAIVWTSWIILLGLAWLGWIIPEPLAVDDLGVLIAPPLSAFVPSSLVLIAALVLLRLNVNRVRSGEFLGRGDTELTSNPFGGFRVASYLSVLLRPCPTTSPLRAAWWREQQLTGFANHAVFGVFMALCSLVTIYLLFISGEFKIGVEARQIIGMSFAWYIVIGIATPLSIFDLKYGNQQAYVGPYSRTRPISTATLAAFKAAAVISGLLVAALTMIISIHVAGPIFVQGFYGTAAEFWRGVIDNWEYSIVESVARGLLLLTFFGSVVCIYAATVTWLILNSRKVMWYILAIPAYALLLYIVIVVLTNSLELRTTIVQVVGLHLWLLLLAALGITAYFLRTVLRDRVLRGTQLAALLAASGFILLHHLIYTRQENVFAPTRELVFAVADSLQGLLPLFAAALLLWTLHRVRHT